MVLFDVPGWSVPGAPVAVPSKKRKPPQGLDQIQAATVNVEKLMRRLATEQTHDRTKGDHNELSADADAPQPPKKKRRRVKDKVQQSYTPARGDGEQNTPRKKRKDGQKKTRDDKVTSSPSLAPSHPTAQPSGNALTNLQRGMKQSLDGARFRYVNPYYVPRTPLTTRAPHFRWINEELYKSDGAHAHAMMREDPAVFDDVRFSCLPPAGI
jgi:ribosomal RNA-processing protein 8